MSESKIKPNFPSPWVSYEDMVKLSAALEEVVPLGQSLTGGIPWWQQACSGTHCFLQHTGGGRQHRLRAPSAGLDGLIIWPGPEPLWLKSGWSREWLGLSLGGAGSWGDKPTGPGPASQPSGMKGRISSGFNSDSSRAESTWKSWTCGVLGGPWVQVPLGAGDRQLSRVDRQELWRSSGAGGPEGVRKRYKRGSNRSCSLPEFQLISLCGSSGGYEYPGRNFPLTHSPFKMIPTALSVHCFSTAPKTGDVAVNWTKLCLQVFHIVQGLDMIGWLSTAQHGG